MTAGERLAQWVEDREGLKELTGTNDVPLIQAHYADAKGLPWCAALLLIGILELELPRPLGNTSRRGWRWHNRSVWAWWRNAQRAGTAMGPACHPKRGDLMFHGSRKGSDAGSGRGLGHIDIVTAFDPVGLQTHVIGGNVGNAIRARVINPGSANALGYGQIVKPKATP